MTRMRVRVLTNARDREVWRGRYLVVSPHGFGLAGAETFQEAWEAAHRMHARFAAL